MKKNISTVAAIAAALLISHASAEVSITATPGMDYNGSTVSVSGAGAATTATLAVAGQSYPFALSGGAGSCFIPANVVVADKVYDATLTIGEKDYAVRLYQGEAGFTPQAWFVEAATSPSSQGTWSKDVPAVENNRFVFKDDGEEMDETTYAPSNAQADRLAIVEMDVTFTAPLPDASVPSLAGVQAAVRLVGGTGDTCNLACLVDGAWYTNKDIAVAANVTNAVRVTTDRMNGSVCYEVKRPGDASYGTLFSGKTTSVTKDMESIAFAGEGSIGTITGQSNEDTADAYVCQAGGTKYKSVEAAVADSKTSITLLWDASWFAPETEGTYAISGDKALEVTGGKIASGTTLPENVTLTGGKYTSNALAAKVASGYRMAERVTSDAYTHEVLNGSSQIAADEKIYPVTSGSTTVDIAFSKSELVDKGIGVTSDMSDADVQKKLNATGSNSNPAWENVVLGLDNNDASSIPVAAPVQSTDATKVTFRLGGVTIDPKYNANVYYRVVSGTTESDPALASDAISVPLPDSGVQYYQLKVDAAGAH